ncbi:ATP-binding cassette domain-containing protein [Deinococcus malanensis]
MEWLDRRGRRSSAVKTRAERVALTEAPLPERQIRMRLLAGTARARLVAWGEHLGKCYGEHTVLHDVAFKLRQGDRVALMGANGTGKTTLMRLLAGEIFPDEAVPAPVFQVASGVSVASLDQIWHGLTPGEGLRAQFERRFGSRAAALLGGAGFTAADWLKTPEVLSGGERARAGLALVSGLRADLLLLDEPTNHLDVEALQALEAAVHAYAGAVVIVTHDRRFAREVANRLWVIEDAQLREPHGWGSREYRDPARGLEGDPPLHRRPPPHGSNWDRWRPGFPHCGRPWTDPGEPQRPGRGAAACPGAPVAGTAVWSLQRSLRRPQYDGQVREPPLTVRAQKLGDWAAGQRGGMFWAAQDADCPHLAWDGHTLRFSESPPAWFGAALLGVRCAFCLNAGTPAGCSWERAGQC